MKYHVDFNNLNEYKIRLDNDIEIIEEELHKIFQAHGELNWIGKSYDTMTTNLYARLEILKKMTNMLELISNFLTLASTNYSEGMDEIKKQFEKTMSELKYLRQKGEI